MQAKTLDLFMRDPIEYFDHSITKMHTIPRAERHRQAMAAEQPGKCQLRHPLR